ncbi:MAG: HTH domain-containing protein [candidate division Zixibacteria bacterium]|nr:HTH domain-containing protein [candidate division Zixibacteria bacterium]
MTKTERLMNLINLIKSREVVTVQDMSREFGISQRTVYRDLNTLSKMNIPVYYENGYRLGQDTLFGSNGFNDEEKELLRYSLRQNPLVSDPYLGGKFKDIEKKIFDAGQNGSPHSTNIFLWETEESLLLPVPKAKILNSFIRAIMDSRKVNLRLKNRILTTLPFIPVAVKMKRDGSYLVITTGQDIPSQEISIDDVESLDVSPERIDRGSGELLKSK